MCMHACVASARVYGGVCSLCVRACWCNLIQVTHMAQRELCLLLHRLFDRLTKASTGTWSTWSTVSGQPAAWRLTV